MFFTMNRNLKWGVDGWTDEQAQNNFPLQLLRPSTCVNRCFKGHFSFSKTTTVQNYFEIHE